MGRQIRMSHAAALAAGLLDPAVADLVRKASPTPKTKSRKSKAAKSAVTSALASSQVEPATKKRPRSVSRPAMHPTLSAGPAGDGRFDLDQDDRIIAADFTFDLVPVPKERARVVRNPETEIVTSYTPARTKYFSKEVRRVIEKVFGSRSPVAGPVKLTMTFVMEVPRSWPKWKRAAALEGLIVPTGRPDMDNLEKALLDAFNETLIVDDAYVIDRQARKIYGEVPKILARVEQTGQFDINAKRSEIDTWRRLRAAQSQG